MIGKGSRRGKRRPTPGGLVLYDGPSRIDGRRIVCILTGLLRPSENQATGPIPQAWILTADVHPMTAMSTGEDASVCGDCPLRVGRLCYVVWGPSEIWKAWRRGKYPQADQNYLAALRGRMVRIGAYGNPSAVPARVWRQLLRYAGDSVGYDHRWREKAVKPYRQFLMASVETPEQRAAAKARGWRTYRIKAPDDPVLAGERECPKQSKFPHPLTCERCGWCSGAGGGDFDVVTDYHGGNNLTEARFRRVQLTVV